jgi:hypothetical protein|tara:strand:- start:519 stop:890 length:372 start_codon:yes stop_codon:yes gene_type:complete
METNMMILAGLGLIVSAVTTWWYKNKSNVLKKVADELEDRIEDATGLDIELDSVIDEAVLAAENVADEVHESVVDSLESGDFDVDTLKSLTVSALKDKLKEIGLPVSGKKADLIARLITASSK